MPSPLETTVGWAVMITRESDGSTFLCCNPSGDVTPVWSKRNRSQAVAHKKHLRSHGFRASVVPVVYPTPRIITGP